MVISRIAWIVAGTLLLAACASTPDQNPSNEPAQMLEDLNSVDEFKTMFNEDAGVTRLVLLMSPT